VALQGFRFQSVRASHAQMAQSSGPAVDHDTGMVKDFLEFSGGGSAVS